MKFLIAALLICSLAGCTSQVDSAIIPPGPPLNFQFCEIAGSVGLLPGAKDAAIDGWPFVPGVATPYLEVGSCQSIHLEEQVFFNQSFAWLQSNDQEPPDACKDKFENNILSLEWIVVSNSSLHGALVELGAPALLGNVDVNIETASMPSASVSVSAPGLQIELENSLMGEPGRNLEAGLQLAWQKDGILSILSLQLEAYYITQSENLMTGTFDGNFGEIESDQWVGNTEFYQEYFHSSELFKFEDTSCESPIGV